MGCGKSKHDVVTGNTIRKPSEAESVKGKESMKKQGSCRCRKTNDISAVVSGDPPQTTVEKSSMKPEGKEAGEDCGEKKAEETNGNKKPEEKEPTTLPPVTAVVPENVVAEAKETITSSPENFVTEEQETTISPPVTAIMPEDVVTEETVNNVDESVLAVDEQIEKIDIETVVEEEKSVEDENDGINDGDVETEVTLPEVEESKSDVQTPTTTELEVEETMTTENGETAATENDEIPALKDEDQVDAVEEKPADITKEVESA